MKYLIISMTVLFQSLAFSYAHDGLYRSKARPYAAHCESRAERAGVSRSNEQVLINNCLQDFMIRASRAVLNEFAEYDRTAGLSQGMMEYSHNQARQDLISALHMLEDDIFTDPVTSERLTGHEAQIHLEIELGRRLDQLNSMQNQPQLINE